LRGGAMSEKPLFIPLKALFYDQFISGQKLSELRLYGPRWNEKTCRIGREVILSKGYGKKHRVKGKIWQFYKRDAHSFAQIPCEKSRAYHDKARTHP